MPFPFVDGRAFAEIGQELIRDLTFELGHDFNPATKQNFSELFRAIDAVSTQLYDDVQRLKKLAMVHGWQIEGDDPSQAPID